MFRAMFQNDMEEATSGKVEIKVNKQEEIKVEKGGNPDRKRWKLR